MLIRPTVAGIASFLACCTASAAETNAYVNGTSGLLAGTVPPPGKYYLMYNRLYRATDYRNESGDSADIGFDIAAFANVHRVIHVTDYKLWGADYMWNAVVPIVNVDLDIDAFGVSGSDLGIGDLNVEPFVIEWHRPRWDLGFVYGFYAPTGQRDDAQPSLPGKGFWTHYAGIGATYFLDEQRTWSASVLSRYEIHSKRKDVDITPGDDFSFEWGVGKQVNPRLLMGISGYAQWQVSDDSGSDVNYDASVHDRVFGIGPEVHYLFPDIGWQMQFRVWKEFEAVDRPEGYIATLTLATTFE